MGRKMLVALLLAITLLLLVSCGVSKNKAVDIALQSIGTSKVYVQKWEVELDKSKSPAVYMVTAWREGKYVIGVDSKTGNIVSSEFTPDK